MVQDDTMKTNALDGLHAPVEEPMKIIHKEQDAISAFCLNQVKRRYMTSCVLYSSVANSGSIFENSLAVLSYVYVALFPGGLLTVRTHNSCYPLNLHLFCVNS